MWGLDDYGGGISEAHMKGRSTLYADSLIDYRKMLMCIGVLALTVFPVFQEPSALSATILVQGVSNIDNFWDFLKDRKICKPLRNTVKVLIFLSVVAIIIALLNFMNGLFAGAYGMLIKIIALAAVGFPLVVLFMDSHMNREVEEEAEEEDV